MQCAADRSICRVSMEFGPRDIVALLEVCGVNDWSVAFFHPFEAIEDFRPEMDGTMRVLTCVMNLKRTIEEEDWATLEDAVIKIERVPHQFIETDELEELSLQGDLFRVRPAQSHNGLFLVLETSVRNEPDWKELKQSAARLEKKWREMIPKSKLAEFVRLVQTHSAPFAENLRAVLTPETFYVVNSLAGRYTEATAIHLLTEMESALQSKTATKPAIKPATKTAQPTAMPKCSGIGRKRRHVSKSTESSGLSESDIRKWNRAIGKHFYGDSQKQIIHNLTI